MTTRCHELIKLFCVGQMLGASLGINSPSVACSLRLLAVPSSLVPGCSVAEDGGTLEEEHFQQILQKSLVSNVPWSCVRKPCTKWWTCECMVLHSEWGPSTWIQKMVTAMACHCGMPAAHSSWSFKGHCRLMERPKWGREIGTCLVRIGEYKPKSRSILQGRILADLLVVNLFGEVQVIIDFWFLIWRWLVSWLWKLSCKLIFVLLLLAFETAKSCPSQQNSKSHDFQKSVLWENDPTWRSFQVCLLIAAEFDAQWARQRRPDPPVKPRSHAARARLEQRYEAKARSCEGHCAECFFLHIMNDSECLAMRSMRIWRHMRFYVYHDQYWP